MAILCASEAMIYETRVGGYDTINSVGDKRDIERLSCLVGKLKGRSISGYLLVFVSHDGARSAHRDWVYLKLRPERT